MSWDIFVQHIPEDVRCISDMREKHHDFKPSCIGRRLEIIEKIKAVVPEADFANPAWGIIKGKGFSIEVNMGDNEECKGFALHVRGGDDAVFIVCDILEKLGLRAFDPSSETGLFQMDAKAQRAMRHWRKYRAKIVENHSTR